MDGIGRTGAGLYAAAGLLEGKTTTTHWGFRDNLRAMGIDVVAERVVWQGNHVSGAGVSAGIDMALSLTERVHWRKLAEALQLVIEYDPQPPLNSGSPTKADASTLRLAFRLLVGDRPVRFATEVIGQASAARVRRARRALTGRRRGGTGHDKHTLTSRGGEPRTSRGASHDAAESTGRAPRAQVGRQRAGRHFVKRQPRRRFGRSGIRDELDVFSCSAT
jgi:hypothetical protein